MCNYEKLNELCLELYFLYIIHLLKNLHYIHYVSIRKIMKLSDNISKNIKIHISYIYYT